METDNDMELQEIIRGRDFDLKRLVRLLHISDPANLVMAIVGIVVASI